MFESQTLWHLATFSFSGAGTNTLLYGLDIHINTYCKFSNLFIYYYSYGKAACTYIGGRPTTITT